MTGYRAIFIPIQYFSYYSFVTDHQSMIYSHPISYFWHTCIFPLKNKYHSMPPGLHNYIKLWTPDAMDITCIHTYLFLLIILHDKLYLYINRYSIILEHILQSYSHHCVYTHCISCALFLT